MICNLEIPAKFDCDDFLAKVHELNKRYEKNNIFVYETYGCIPASTVGNARPATELAKVDEDTLKRYIDEGNKYGITLNYIMNSVWSNGMEFTQQGRERILSEIEKVVSLGVKKVSIASPGILKIVRNNFKDLAITVSINNCVDSVHAIKRWEDQNVSKILLNRHINRDFPLLKSMINQTHTELELLVNSMCNLFCSLHQYHNIINSCRSTVGGTDISSNFPQNQCAYNMLSNPQELLCSAWIRPEDLHIYEELGIHTFKLDGRCIEAEDVLFQVEAYMSRHYEGNFFNLFDFYNQRQEQPFYLELDNRKLDGYLEELIKCKVSCRACGGNNAKCKALASEIKCSNERKVALYKSMIKQQLESEVF